MKKLKNQFLFVFVLAIFIFSCKPTEQKNSWAYKEGSKNYTVFPEELFSINFCKIQLIDISREFINKKIDFQYYDNSMDGFTRYSGNKNEVEQTEDLKTNYFIGTELDKSKILEVLYADPYREGWFHLTIKFTEDYYEILLELLGKKLGKQNVNYNRLNYNEVSWDADPDHSVPTCISNLIISKKLRYDNSEKGVCYLEIITRSRDSHVK